MISMIRNDAMIFGAFQVSISIRGNPDRSNRCWYGTRLNLIVQDIPYEALREKLESAKQIVMPES